MITIGKKQINLDIDRLLNTLQSDMLKRYGILYFRDRKISGSNVQFTCPFHSHGQEKRPSCGMNVDSGKFNCFACGEKGSLEYFVGKCFHEDEEYGKKWLLEVFSDSVFYGRQGLKIQERKEYVPPQYVSEEELDNYRWYHKYMWKRKLTPEVVELFDIGYDKNTNCLTFPVKDISGNCVFVARRSVSTKFFHYPEGTQKPVYGLDKCLNAKTVYVCESFINALTLWTYGLKAVALIGTGDLYQYEILKKTGIRKYYLCLDGDRAGRLGTNRFIKHVNNGSIKVVVPIPEGKDVNDLTKRQFMQLVTQADETYNNG